MPEGRSHDTRRVERIRVGPVEVHLARRGEGPLAPVVPVDQSAEPEALRPYAAPGSSSRLAAP